MSKPLSERIHGAKKSKRHSFCAQVLDNAVVADVKREKYFNLLKRFEALKKKGVIPEEAVLDPHNGIVITHKRRLSVSAYEALARICKKI